jgi:hypothetical protein
MYLAPGNLFFLAFFFLPFFFFLLFFFLDFYFANTIIFASSYFIIASTKATFFFSTSGRAY